MRRVVSLLIWLIVVRVAPCLPGAIARLMA
jgi:hypothetical protein